MTYLRSSGDFKMVVRNKVTGKNRVQWSNYNHGTCVPAHNLVFVYYKLPWPSWNLFTMKLYLNMMQFSHWIISQHLFLNLNCLFWFSVIHWKRKSKFSWKVVLELTAVSTNNIFYYKIINICLISCIYLLLLW